MIYVSARLQKKLIPRFHYALNPGEYLFLVTSESIGEFDTLFTTEARKFKVLRKNEASEPSFHGLSGFHWHPPSSLEESSRWVWSILSPRPRRARNAVNTGVRALC